MNHDDPLTFIHQAVCHQLQHAGDDIANGDGLVVDFDYEEDIEEAYTPEIGESPPDVSREVTLELTYLLPE